MDSALYKLYFKEQAIEIEYQLTLGTLPTESTWAEQVESA